MLGGHSMHFWPTAAALTWRSADCIFLMWLSRLNLEAIILASSTCRVSKQAQSLVVVGSMCFQAPATRLDYTRVWLTCTF